MPSLPAATAYSLLPSHDIHIYDTIYIINPIAAIPRIFPNISQKDKSTKIFLSCLAKTGSALARSTRTIHTKGILAAHPIRIYLTTFFPAVFPAPCVRLYALPSINGRPILPRLIITILNIISICLIGFQFSVS